MRRILETLNVLWVGVRVGLAGWWNDPHPTEGECYEEPAQWTIEELREAQRISLIVAVTVSIVTLAFIAAMCLSGKL